MQVIFNNAAGGVQKLHLDNRRVTTNGVSMIASKSRFHALILCVFAFSAEAHADVVFKTRSTTSRNGMGAGSSTVMTVKVKGDWQRTEMELPGLAKIPGLPPGGMGMISLMNKRTGETYFLHEGQFMTSKEMVGGSNVTMSAGAIPQMPSMAESAAESLKDYHMEWEDTGKLEKIGNYNCRIYIRRNFLKEEAISEAKVWVTRDLKHLEPLLKQLTIELKENTTSLKFKAPEGIEIREESEMDLAKTMMASQPPGTRMPEGMKSMRMKTVMEFISLESVELPAEEFAVKKMPK
jgi:hypothetical protein